MKTRTPRRFIVLMLLACVAPAARADDKTHWWADDVAQALGHSEKNRGELEKALTDVPNDQRKGMTFLIANMPQSDLRALKADFLLENVDLAYKARKQVPWGAKLSEDIFLNDVLPYANVNESRDPWRKELYELCLPIVKDCKTPAEAAQKLNRTVYDKLKVHYSTQRKQPHQSPKESIEQGKASCTGLSIILSDACRSVAIPTRLAGTPLWMNNRGNHTWVEIWDDGWHFTGACEADPQGLDRGWFVGDAAQAKRDMPEHAIYASSFKKTKLAFPLVWSPDCKDVFAENVTDRYARKSEKQSHGLTKEQHEQVVTAARDFFSADADKQATWKADPALDKLLATDDAAVRAAVWEAYRSAPIHEKLKKDFHDNQVRYDRYVSPYVVREIGKKPEGGWPLVIAMHGGGGAPKEVNDSQWKMMQTHYHDQPETSGYKLLALRAPNDSWNGFYDDYVPPLVTNLIRQFGLFGDVNLDRVFLIGYSHGGYGAFFIGPKIPDRFAAVHASAAAPTDGTISPLTLRNTPFTFMIGENDNAYGRRERCERFDKQVQKLKDENKGDFPVTMEFKKGHAHSDLPDRDKLKEMLPKKRNATPRHLSWELTDPVIANFYWLSMPKAEKGQSIDATIGDSQVEITTKKAPSFALGLDTRLISFDRPIKIVLDGVEQKVTPKASYATLCRSMARRGDPALAYTFEVPLEAGKK